jgi:peptidoglycan/LPS O-acetylase OafA/YrhL
MDEKSDILNGAGGVDLVVFTPILAAIALGIATYYLVERPAIRRFKKRHAE